LKSSPVVQAAVGVKRGCKNFKGKEYRLEKEIEGVEETRTSKRYNN
jgi:hypothetical protein